MAEDKKTEKQEKKQEAPKEDVNLIIRIAGVDLDGNKAIIRALPKIKGIGMRTAKNIATSFENETGVKPAEKIGKLSPENAKKLEAIIAKPMNAGIPSWSMNRRKDVYTGEDTHLVMSELDFSLRNDLQRLSEIKSYRGLRHMWKLPVRGQRTKSTHRGKGGAVGVTKKDAKK